MSRHQHAHARKHIHTHKHGVCMDEQHISTDCFEHTACPCRLLHIHSPVPSFFLLSQTLLLYLSLFHCHPICQPCSVPGTPPCRSCQPASKTCNLHSDPFSLLPQALTGRAVMFTGIGFAYPPPTILLLQQFCRLVFADIGNGI